MANNTIKVKRTSVSGRTPNTTNSGNAQYIGAGEFGLNMADRILYTSDGTNLIEIGANNTTVNISNSITVGTTTSINSSLISVGNASVNTMISSSTVNTDIFQADVAIYVGANVDILPTGLYVGNSSVNTVVNATGFYVNGAAISTGPGGSATRVYQSFTATAGQNTFAVTGGYVNNYIDVFYNGVHLSNTEYTQNGTHIQLTENAIVGALVEVAGYKDLIISDYTVNTAAQYTWTNTHTFNGNIFVTGISANGSLGTAGYTLKSNGTSTYWDVGGGDTSSLIDGVAAGSGLTGGGTEGNVTVSVLANNGITANSTGVFVKTGNSQLIANATGLWIDQSQINHNSLSNYSANQHVDHTTVSIATANGIAGGGTIAATRNLYVASGSGLTSNSTGVHVVANSGIVANATGVFVNANNGLSTNSTGVFVVAGNSQVVSNSTGVWINQAQIDHDSLLNYIANDHIDHTTVQIATANGIAGGGTIAATRNLYVAAGSGLISNSTGVHVLANTGVVANSTGLFVTAAGVNTDAQYLWTNTHTWGNSTVNAIINSTSFTLQANTTSNAALTISTIRNATSKTVTILDPVNTDSVTIFHAREASTLDVARAVVRGTNPTVTFNVFSGTDRTSAAATHISANIASNTTTGNTYTSFTTASIAANSWVWVTVTATSGTVNEFSLSLGAD